MPNSSSLPLLLSTVSDQALIDTAAMAMTKAVREAVSAM